MAFRSGPGSYDDPFVSGGSGGRNGEDGGINELGNCDGGSGSGMDVTQIPLKNFKLR